MAVKKRGRRGGRASTRKDEIKAPNISDETRLKETKDKKALVVAQEIKIARLLANNDKKVRDKVLKRLHKWLTVRSQSSFVFTKADFMSLWKGLFYCMWLSDKMLIQEDLAESISKLVHCLNSRDAVVLYTSCALRTLATEWFGIDQYRLDKFSMLVRRILRQTFVACKNQSWNMEWITETSQMFTRLFLHVKTDLGFKLHITEIYLEELAKVSNGNIPEDVVHELIKPFVEYLITSHDERQIRHIMRHVFRYLIFQSNMGLDYMEKFNAWKAAGFPCRHIDDMEKLEVDMEDNSNNEDNFSETETQDEIEKPLDPRAGRVDVELPQIPFNAAKIAELLSMHKFHPLSTAKSRRQLLRILDEYTEVSQGSMPLGRKSIRKPKSQKKEMDSRKAALRLIKFEKSLGSDKEEEKEKSAREKLICDQEINTKLKSEKKEIDSKKAALPLNQFEKSLRSNKKRKREELICDQESEKLICDQEINKKLKSEKKMMNSKKTALPLIQFEKILLSDQKQKKR